MGGITILGLGLGSWEQLTIEAQEALEGARELYLRTLQHPLAPLLSERLAVHSFDQAYETHRTFEEVYEEIAARVLELGRREEGVLYGVPGHPLVGERAVHLILERARETGLPVRIIPGVSFIEAVAAALEIDPLEGLQVVDGMGLAARRHPNLDPDMPALVGQVYSREVASEVKLTLMNLYPAEHQVALVRRAGTAEQMVQPLPLYELDRSEALDDFTSLYVPPLPAPSSLSTLQDVVAHLRAPDGCPWDRTQTYRSLRPYLLEETCEALEALDGEDRDKLQEELGDLLMEVVSLVQIAAEGEEFTMADVARGIISKLVRRHPHVFGEAQVSGVDEIWERWEEIKEEERGEEGSPLDGVPQALPALAWAQALQERAARVGFDWRDIKGVAEKVVEEVRELEQAEGKSELEEEFGDLLFSLVNLARWLAVNAESALRGANARFQRRFAQMEHLAAERGRKLKDMSLEEQDILWEAIKGREG